MNRWGATNEGQASCCQPCACGRGFSPSCSGLPRPLPKEPCQYKEGKFFCVISGKAQLNQRSDAVVIIDSTCYT
eukprot:1150829-Pelagomonas_calceolata.AAC.2